MKKPKVIAPLAILNSWKSGMRKNGMRWYSMGLIQIHFIMPLVFLDRSVDWWSQGSPVCHPYWPQWFGRWRQICLGIWASAVQRCCSLLEARAAEQPLRTRALHMHCEWGDDGQNMWRSEPERSRASRLCLPEKDAIRYWSRTYLVYFLATFWAIIYS